MKETDGDRLDSCGTHVLRHALRFLLGEPEQRHPVGPDALGRLEAQLSRDRRGHTCGAGQVVEVVPRLPSDLEHVGESFGGHERCPGELLLEHRVRDPGRAGDHSGPLRDEVSHPRQGLAEPRVRRDFHCLRDTPVEHHDIGEGAAGIDADADFLSRFHGAKGVSVYGNTVV